MWCKSLHLPALLLQCRADLQVNIGTLDTVRLKPRSVDLVHTLSSGFNFVCALCCFKVNSSLYFALSRVCSCFCFDSCKMSQNVTFCNDLHEVNSKFHVNGALRMGSFKLRSFWNHERKQLLSCKNQRSCWEKNLKCLNRAVTNFWSRWGYKKNSQGFDLL